MRRIVVFGTTGSGKSWLAERLAAERGLHLVELDALFWGPEWQPAPLDLFRHRVDCETRDGGRVAVGIYGQVRDIVWQRADTLVWLDLPLPLVMWRLLTRTIRRIATREDLWGTGNRETFTRTFFSRTVIRLRSARDIERFVAGRADLSQALAA